MFSCGIAADSSTNAWRIPLMFIGFRLRTHFPKLSQKCSIGDMPGLFAGQSRTSMPLTVTIVLVTAAAVLGLVLSC